MRRTELAAGRDHSTLDETELRGIASNVCAASNETASIDPYSTPDPLENSYLTVRESVVYEEVL